MSKFFRDWKIRNKLFFAFGIIMLMFLSVSIYIVMLTNQIISKSREVELKEFQGMNLSMEIRFGVLKMKSVFFSDYSFDLAHRIEDIEILKDKFSNHIAEYKDLNENNSLMLSKLDELQLSIEEYYSEGQAIFALYNLSGINERYKEELIEKLNILHDKSEGIEEQVAELQDEEVINLSLGLAEIDTQARNLQKVCAVLFISILVFSIIITLKLTGMIQSSLLLLSQGIAEVSKGKFGHKFRVSSKDELGEVIKGFNEMSATLREITISKEMLEKEVKERMAAEIRLTEYTQEVESINRELDSFTYIISHDLKEPLRSIEAFSKFILDDHKDKLDEDGIHNLNRVRKNAKKMKELIEDLLEVSRIERKRNPFSEAAVDDIIEETKARLEYSLEEKNIKIIINNSLPVIFCDRIRIVEVFVNLMSNAIKFMDKPEPAIEIGYQESKEYHKFYIKDNGIGILKEYHEKIFDIFQRVNKKEEYEGTGAGLTIVKKIIQMHHGKVWVESEFGKGTTFWFTLLKDKEAILSRRRIGEILMEANLVTGEQIEQALNEQRPGIV